MILTNFLTLTNEKEKMNNKISTDAKSSLFLQQNIQFYYQTKELSRQ
jgi:hypothetical protein